MKRSSRVPRFSFVLCWVSLGLLSKAQAFPSICSIVKTPEFKSCMSFRKSSCICGKFPFKRPCARITYWVPQTFMEVFQEPAKTFFKNMPGAITQLATIKKKPVPFGVSDDNGTYTYHSHTLSVPFSNLFRMLPCGGTRPDKMCFDGMSEHLGKNWVTGMADMWQPAYLAWSLKPKMCLLKGAVTSVSGGGEASYGHEGGCSYPMSWLSKYPPSSHSVCNGWGIFFPRSGIYHGASQTAGALMIASRMKILSSEIFKSTPATPNEKWQMITPQSSSCFREGQNLGILESPLKRVTEIGRLSGKREGYLFATWKQVSCCVDYPRLPAVYAAISIIKSICRGL